MTSLLPALIGYLVGEFVLMSKALRERTRRFDRGAYVAHGCVVAFCLFLVLLWDTHSVGSSLIAGLIIGLGHVLVEFVMNILRAVLERAEGRLDSWFGRFDRGLYLVTLFLLEQVSHFFLVALVTWLIWSRSNFLGNLPHHLSQLFMGGVTLQSKSRGLYFAFVTLLGSFGAAEFLKIVLSHSFNPATAKKMPAVSPPVHDPAPSPAFAASQAAVAVMPDAKPDDRIPLVELVRAMADWLRTLIATVRSQGPTTLVDELPLGTGRWIGITERVMMMMMVALNAWQGVGFIIAAKSMARFQELNTREKGEYYIIGTLMSSIIGVAMGLLLINVKFQ